LTLLTDKQKLDILDGFHKEVDRSVEDRRTNPDWRIADTKTKIRFDATQWEEMDRIWITSVLDHLGVKHEFI